MERRTARAVVSALIVLAVAICLWPRPAAADSADLETLNFSGTVYCAPGPTCPAGTAVTGTYSFDPDSSSITGPWSFSTPFGALSSSDAGSAAGFDNSDVFGFPTNDFYSFGFAANGLDLTLSFTDPSGTGAILPATPNVVGSIIPVPVGTLVYTSNLLSGAAGTAAFYFNAGTASPVATPEPSTVLLLGLGLLGLIAVKFARKVKPLPAVRA